MDPAGPVARDIFDLTVVLFVLGAAVFALFVVLFVAALRRGAAEADDAVDGPDAGETHGYLSTLRATASRRLVIGGGVLLPTVVIAVVFSWTLETMNDLPKGGDADALVVEVTGHQWWWDVRYPESGIVLTDELHIEVGRPVELHLTSADVIHSFWVPALGGKMDAFPDFTNTLVLEASEPGVLRGHCAEFCGLHHASMGITVVAHEPEDFDAWLAAESRDRDPAAGGSRRARAVTATARARAAAGAGSRRLSPSGARSASRRPWSTRVPTPRNSTANGRGRPASTDAWRPSRTVPWGCASSSPGSSSCCSAAASTRS